MTPRAARLLRGTLLGSVATLLAALSHLVAGGVAPGPLALVLGGVFASAVGVAAVGRRLPLLRTALAVAIGQLAFHLGFSLLGTGGHVIGAAGHHHASALAIVTDPAGAIAQGGGAMWCAHLLAGLGTIAYLRLLERRVWAMLAQLGRFVAAALGIRITPRTRPVFALTVRDASWITAVLPGDGHRRGPPRLLPV